MIYKWVSYKTESNSCVTSNKIPPKIEEECLRSQIVIRNINNDIYMYILIYTSIIYILKIYIYIYIFRDWLYIVRHVI